MLLGEAVTVPECHCTACGHRCDTVSECGGKGRKPNAGDFTLCIRCAHVMAFDENLMLRELTGGEKELAYRDPVVLKAQSAIKAIHGIRNN